MVEHRRLCDGEGDDQCTDGDGHADGDEGGLHGATSGSREARGGSGDRGLGRRRPGGGRASSPATGRCDRADRARRATGSKARARGRGSAAARALVLADRRRRRRRTSRPPPRAVERAFGPIDVWVNDAMASVFSPVKEMTAGEFRRVTEVTYLGYVYGTLAALRRMLPRDRGTIVQVGSALAYRGIPLQSAYCGAKHAIQGFTESLRCELIHDGSRRPRDDGADAGAEHAAVRLGARAGCRASRSRCRRSSSPRSPPTRSSGRPTTAAREIDVGWPTVDGDRRQQACARARSTATSAATGYDAQQTDEPEDPDRPDNLWRAGRPATTARTAPSTPGARRQRPALGRHASAGGSRSRLRARSARLRRARRAGAET